MPEDEEEDEEDHSEFSASFETSVTSAEDSSDPAKVTAANVVQEFTSSGEVIIEHNIDNVLRPDLSETRKENNRDTMSYLKAKRINRHKNTEGTDPKKFKPSD